MSETGKRPPGRPVGSLSRNRKGAATITLRLAADCRAIVDGLVPRVYPTRTAAIEALVRMAQPERAEQVTVPAERWRELLELEQRIDRIDPVLLQDIEALREPRA